MIRIRYIDTFCQGTQHLQFNASLLVMCSLIASEVEYRGAQDIALLAGNPKNVLWRKLFVITGNGRSGLIMRYFVGAVLNLWQLIVVPRNTILVYNYNNLFCVRALNFLNKILGKHVIVFCHGEMELLVTEPHKGGMLHKLLTRLARDFFLRPNGKIASSTYFFVMGEAIYSNLAELLTADKMAHFCQLDHPYIFNPSNTSKPHTTLNLGTVGVLNPIKGGDSLCVLADMLKQNNITNVRLSVTGTVSYPKEILLERGISLPSNGGTAPIGQQEFASRIEALDYIIFFYEKDSYKLTASGAIMDAIDRRRPVIAIKNDYFTYLFNKYGEFGYLVEDIQEMLELIVKIKSGSNEQRLFDFISLQENLSPLTLSNDFKIQLQHIGFI